MQSFQENHPFFLARVVLKPLLSLIGRLIAQICSLTMLHVSHPYLVSLSFYTIPLCFFFKFAGFLARVVLKPLLSLIGRLIAQICSLTMLHVSHPYLVSLSFYTIPLCFFFKFAGFFIYMFLYKFKRSFLPSEGERELAKSMTKRKGSLHR